MPLAFLIAAVFSGLTSAALWLSLGGSGLMAFVIYVLSGQLVMAAMLSHTALRKTR